MENDSISYRDAGVDIDEADRAVGDIRKLARATFTDNVLTDIGSFGACFQMPKLRKPILISSVDGVGTKLKVAFMTGRHDTIGEDLVNHCVNDIAVQGAVPLFFLDYLAVGVLDANVAREIVSGIARGCKANKCALIGGETAEMPGFYAAGEYDLAGTVVGCCEQEHVINGKAIEEGDVLLGLPSSGLHTNGYSLARKLLFEVAGFKPDTPVDELASTVGDALLAVHRSYLQPIQELHLARILKGAAHITGGGITGNLPRILPTKLAAVVKTNSWTIPPLFQMLKKIGNVPEDDFRRTFNLGIGMILVVSEMQASRAMRILQRTGEKPVKLGSIVTRKRGLAALQYE